MYKNRLGYEIHLVSKGLTKTRQNSLKTFVIWFVNTIDFVYSFLKMNCAFNDSDLRVQIKR